MSTSAANRSFRQEKKSSFFKLIESFAVELGTLKKELGRGSELGRGAEPSDRSSEPLHGLDEDVGGLFLRASPCTGLCSGGLCSGGLCSGGLCSGGLCSGGLFPRASPCSGLCSGGHSPLSGYSGLRDSGYSGSLYRKPTVLERLVRTHSVWLQLGLDRQGALKILKNQPPGTFVVRRSSSQQRKALCVRTDSDSDPVQDFGVRESQFSFSLEGSGLSFADLFRLVAFCCLSRDVLPFPLKLPDSIASAQTSAELDHISKQGPGFWDAQSSKRKSSAFSALSISSPRICPNIKTRTPSELECCQSNGALCFINPLFIKVHQEDAGDGTAPGRHDEPKRERRALEPDGNAELEGGRVSPSGVGENPRENGNCRRSPPPPRPPPPRFARSGQLTRTRSMPEKVPWIAVPKEKSEERDRKSRDGSLLSRLGSSLSISPSTSPPKRLFGISSPITIPKPSLPLSLGSFSSSPRRPSKMSPVSSSSQEDAQCHLAMQDHVIERALRRARLQRSAAVACAGRGSRDDDKDGDGADERKREGGQRLSDMSLSSESDESVDFARASFFFPPLHDPNPPTREEMNAHLPLSLPPYSSMEEEDDDEEEEDDDEDEEEEEDYGVGLESDQEQDQDLTLVPPGHRTKRRTSASAVVIQNALKGQLRKMSGVFNSLLTPEKRAVRKVLELSRDKSTYFGGLVQDFLGYMTDQGQEQGLGLDSGSELLQTVRQFLTQMKSYLRQSSELEPPIESLIPEDQIDRVLEKAMHKCVLKPLKPVISGALQGAMVRSGAWTELKDNMSLAKTTPPAEMGVSDALPPDAVAIEKIRQKFQAMCKLYSPEKKVGRLLQVCKLIYTVMEDNSGRMFGADDFLPMLTFVLAQCDMPQLDNEILYMMELLDPTLLNGEGGYYLTSAYGAMSLIKNFQEEQAARVLSSHTRDTLRQWHRRRTMQRTAPSIDDFQNFLRVALQELDSGCTAKTLSVHPQATADEVCSLCAVKFSVAEPENYGLFLIAGGSAQQLAPDTHPQKIKAELHSREQPDAFHFVYRRMDFNAAANRATGATDANANPTNTIPDQENNLSPRLSLSVPQGNICSVSI